MPLPLAVTTRFSRVILSTMLLMGVCHLSRGFSIKKISHPFRPFGTFPSTTKAPSRRFMAVITVEKTEEEWREILTPEQYYVLREEGTEAPNSSAWNTIKEPGTFSCAGCGTPLFTTEAKFDSGTGWPSFYAPVDNEAIETSTDLKLILPRTEVSCASCGGHLGHVFGDGPPPTGQRFCMNGVAMTFQSDAQNPELAEMVTQQQESNPYRLQAMQVLPTVFFNGILGGLFFQSFLARLETAGGITSPMDLFPLLPAVYFGILAIQACERLKAT